MTKTLLLLAMLFAGCTYNKEHEIVMDKHGNFYELTVGSRTLWPSEAYRLTLVDTTKYQVRGFNAVGDTIK